MMIESAFKRARGVRNDEHCFQQLRAMSLHGVAHGTLEERPGPRARCHGSGWRCYAVQGTRVAWGEPCCDVRGCKASLLRSVLGAGERVPRSPRTPGTQALVGRQCARTQHAEKSRAGTVEPCLRTLRSGYTVHARNLARLGLTSQIRRVLDAREVVRHRHLLPRRIVGVAVPVLLQRLPASHPGRSTDAPARFAILDRSAGASRRELTPR